MEQEELQLISLDLWGLSFELMKDACEETVSQMTLDSHFHHHSFVDSFPGNNIFYATLMISEDGYIMIGYMCGIQRLKYVMF